jgi:hypothetical protein
MDEARSLCTSSALPANWEIGMSHGKGIVAFLMTRRAEVVYCSLVDLFCNGLDPVVDDVVPPLASRFMLDALFHPHLGSIRLVNWGKKLLRPRPFLFLHITFPNSSTAGCLPSLYLLIILLLQDGDSLGVKAKWRAGRR